MPRSVEDELKFLVETRSKGSAKRIERIETDHGVYWVKRVEKPSLRYRLQKGDPRKAFDRELSAYHALNAADAPAPKLCAEGADYFVLPDCGVNLRRRLGELEDAGERRSLLLDATQSLAHLHSLGFAHGRPSPKDMCRQGDRELLLDFERYDPKSNTPKGQARDLVIWAFNVAAFSPQMRQDLPDALGTYNKIAPTGNFELSKQWCRKLRWADWLTKPIQLRPEAKAREFKAIPFVLDLFENQT